MFKGMINTPVQRLTLLVGVALAATVVAGCASRTASAPTPTPWPTPIVSEKPRYTVQRGTIEDRFRLSGAVTPLRWDALFFRIDGRLGMLRVAPGDMVEAGDVLAELEMQELLDTQAQLLLTQEQQQDELTLAEANRSFALARARLRLRQEELELEALRAAGAAEQVAIQEIQVQLAQLDVEEIEQSVDPALERELARTLIQLDAIERQIEERTLRAPYSGQIIAVGLNVSSISAFQPQRPRVGDPLAAFTSIIVIAEPEALEIVVAADRTRATELAVGKVVTLTHPLARSAPFTGTVISMPWTNPLSETQSNRGQIIRISLPEETPPMSIGDFVDIDVLVAAHHNTLLLPSLSIRRFSNRAFVVVDDAGRQRRVDVVTGLDNGTQVEILSGLNEGDVVVGQ